MQHRHLCYFPGYFYKQKSENQMIQTAYYWWKFPTTFQLSEIKIWNMASRTNIFLKCHKWIFCSNIIHGHRITLELKFQFQYMMSVSRIFNLNVRKQRKSVKAKPNLPPSLERYYMMNEQVNLGHQEFLLAKWCCLV